MADELRACDVADDFFQYGIEEAFGRHLRALERWNRDADRDFTGIDVVLTPRLAAKSAYIWVQWHACECVEPARGPNCGERARHSLGMKRVIIVAGTADKFRPHERPSGSRHEAEWHHRSVVHRLAIAHELGHVALRHIFNEKDEPYVPPGGWREDSEQEEEARKYAVYLVKLSSEYMERTEQGRHHTNRAIKEAVERVWPRWVESPQGAKFLMWLFQAAD